MKKTVYCLILMILISIILTGCAEEETVFSEYGKVQKIISEPSTLRERTDPASCEEETLGRKDSCYYWVAQNTKNPELCQKLSGRDSTFTKNKCYYWVAFHSKDPSVCEKITVEYNIYTDRNKCYNSVAVELKDPNICEKIINKESLKNTCKEAATS